MGIRTEIADGTCTLFQKMEWAKVKSINVERFPRNWTLGLEIRKRRFLAEGSANYFVGGKIEEGTRRARLLALSRVGTTSTSPARRLEGRLGLWRESERGRVTWRLTRVVEKVLLVSHRAANCGSRERAAGFGRRKAWEQFGAKGQRLSGRRSCCLGGRWAGAGAVNKARLDAGAHEPTTMTAGQSGRRCPNLPTFCSKAPALPRQEHLRGGPQSQ